ncbi:MAG: DUF1156 domain-containing protein [Dehalococcoidia bacterium]
MTTVRTRKKLIEVSIPLDAINRATEDEKTVRHGHPSSLHLWWARRPLSAARAVIFSQMVDDPSACPDEFPTKESQDEERQRLFRLLEQLVPWENSTDEGLLRLARAEIMRSWRRACADNADKPELGELFEAERLPAFHDPFAGGGAIPLEAQRLGLESHASDLNPVAALIEKAMIEVPAKYSGVAPVNPQSREGSASTSARWRGASGLADDVRYYGEWIRDEAERRVGKLYPTVEITPEMARSRPDLGKYVGQHLRVMAWLWARTVKSPSPAHSNVAVPLVTNFMISVKRGKEAYVLPVVERDGYRFEVRAGVPPDITAARRGTKLTRGANFECVMSGTPLSPQHIKSESMAGRMGTRLMAVVAEGQRERVYLSPDATQESAAANAHPEWAPELAISGSTHYLGVKPYGMDRFDEIFTPRQLVTLATIADLIPEARNLAQQHAQTAGLGDIDGSAAISNSQGYADAVALLLSFALNKQADLSNSLCGWEPIAQCPRHLFGRQAIPMVWDFAEGNPLSTSSGSWSVCVDGIVKAFAKAFGSSLSSIPGHASQADAATQSISRNKVVSTDPPYYDNVPYADLSDFFYIWMRRSLRTVFPEVFETVAAPKAEELVAFAYRHEDKAHADAFFVDGMTNAMQRIADEAHPAFPVTVYYAFKQSEMDAGEGAASTGWETFLSALLRAGFSVTGTWPMRTENASRLRGQLSNALASSIVIVCRKRAENAPTATRTEFLERLAEVMREALPKMVAGQVAPVDLAQASIGPGMAVYSGFAEVLRQDGQRVTVREALRDINNAISAYRSERTSSFDPQTRFAIDFYEQFGFAAAPYDNATLLARAQGVGVDTLQDEMLLAAERGQALLVPPASYPAGIAGLERRFAGSAWEACMRLATTLKDEGESATAALVRELGEGASARARELAVWLYTLAEAKQRTQDAILFNALDASWPEIQRLVSSMDRGQQASF